MKKSIFTLVKLLGCIVCIVILATVGLFLYINKNNITNKFYSKESKMICPHPLQECDFVAVNTRAEISSGGEENAFYFFDLKTGKINDAYYCESNLDTELISYYSCDGIKHCIFAQNNKLFYWNNHNENEKLNIENKYYIKINEGKLKDCYCKGQIREIVKAGKYYYYSYNEEESSYKEKLSEEFDRYRKTDKIYTYRNGKESVFADLKNKQKEYCKKHNTEAKKHSVPLLYALSGGRLMVKYDFGLIEIYNEEGKLIKSADIGFRKAGILSADSKKLYLHAKEQKSLNNIKTDGIIAVKKDLLSKIIYDLIYKNQDLDYIKSKEKRYFIIMDTDNFKILKKYELAGNLIFSSTCENKDELLFCDINNFIIYNTNTGKVRNAHLYVLAYEEGYGSKGRIAIFDRGWFFIRKIK